MNHICKVQYTNTVKQHQQNVNTNHLPQNPNDDQMSNDSYNLEQRLLLTLTNQSTHETHETLLTNKNKTHMNRLISLMMPLYIHMTEPI